MATIASPRIHYYALCDAIPAHFRTRCRAANVPEIRRRESWVFCAEAGTLPDESRVRKVMRKTLKAARLPLHFSPHCVRHTFASLLLQQGESPAYVQR